MSTKMTLTATTIAVSLIGASAGWAADSIKIGVMVGVTGPTATYIPPILDAVDLAVNQVNSQGGLFDDRKLESVIADTQSAAQVAVDAANKLVNVENVVALFGAGTSGTTIATAESVSVPGKVLQISPTATSPTLTDLDDDDFLFRVVPSDNYQGQVLAKIVLGEGTTSVAVTYINNDYGVGIANAFKREYEQLGGTVTGFEKHEEKKISYRSELATLAGNGAQALLLIAYAGDSGIRIVRQSLENEFFDKFIGSDGLRDNLLLEQIGTSNLKGTIFTAPTSPPGSEAVDAFEQAYSAEYGSTKDKFYIQQSYDIIFLQALAIEKAGSTDRTAIRDALRFVSNPPGDEILPGEWEKAKRLLADGKDIDYVGASGPHDFDENGDVTGFIGKFIVTDDGYEQVGVFQ